METLDGILNMGILAVRTIKPGDISEHAGEPMRVRATSVRPLDDK